MTTRSAKANALRERHVSILSKTIDTITTLTQEACRSTITVYKGELDSNWNAYNDSFNEHEDSILGKEEQKGMLDEISNIHRDIYGNYVKARVKLGKLAEKIGSNPDMSSLNNSSFEHTENEHVKTFKLPPIKLPKFSGAYNEWPEFKATCQSMLTDKIHDVQRLQYLKEALDGEPREIIRFVMPNDGCYQKAMVLLKNRYENARAIVNDQLNRLYVLPRNDSGHEQVSLLRNIINTINGLKAALEECKIDTTSWDSVLIFNTSQCLHGDSRKAWEEKLQGSREPPLLSTYLALLETRTVILESTQLTLLPIVENDFLEQSAQRREYVATQKE